MPDEPGGRRPARRSSGWQEGFRDAGPYLGLGMQLAFTMVLFTIGGYLLDRGLDTLPWLTIAGAVLGMTAVFIQIVRVSKSIQPSKRTKRTPQTGETGARARDALTPKALGAGASGASTPLRSGEATPADGGGFEEKGREKIAALEQEFARLGTVRDGKLLLPAWDAVDLIERARKERIPVLGINTYLLVDTSARQVDTLDLSAGGVVREGWDEATRFIEDLRDSGLHFEVLLGGED